MQIFLAILLAMMTMLIVSKTIEPLVRKCITVMYVVTLVGLVVTYLC